MLFVPVDLLISKLDPKKLSNGDNFTVARFFLSNTRLRQP